MDNNLNSIADAFVPVSEELPDSFYDALNYRYGELPGKEQEGPWNVQKEAVKLAQELHGFTFMQEIEDPLGYVMNLANAISVAHGFAQLPFPEYAEREDATWKLGFNTYDLRQAIKHLN